MPFLRIMSENKLDRFATITATNAASAALGVANLTNEGKTFVYRSTSTGPQLDVRWTDPQILNMIAACWTNLTGNATWRIRGFTTAGGTQVYDSGFVTACRYVGPPPRRFNSHGVNSNPYGGGSMAVHYAPQMTVRQLLIDFNDATNAAGFIEIARLLTGFYFEFNSQPDVGVTVTWVDQSVIERAESGDLRGERGAKFKKIAFDLSMMRAADRNEIYEIARQVGRSYPVFASLVAGSTDNREEAMYQIYGNFSEDTTLAYMFADAFATSLAIDER